MKKFFLTAVCLAMVSAWAQARLSPQDIGGQAKPTMEERLIRVEEGVKNVEKRLDAVEASLNKRIDDVNRRIDDLRADMTSRLDALMLWLQILSGVLALLFAAIFGTLLMMWKKVEAISKRKSHSRTLLSGVHDSRNGFPPTACGNDIGIRTFPKSHYLTPAVFLRSLVVTVEASVALPAPTSRGGRAERTTPDCLLHPIICVDVGVLVPLSKRHNKLSASSDDLL